MKLSNKYSVADFGSQFDYSDENKTFITNACKSLSEEFGTNVQLFVYTPKDWVSAIREFLQLVEKNHGSGKIVFVRSVGGGVQINLQDVDDQAHAAAHRLEKKFYQ